MKANEKLAMLSLGLMAMAGPDIMGLEPYTRPSRRVIPQKSKEEIKEIVNKNRGLKRFEIGDKIVWASSERVAKTKIEKLKKSKDGTL